MMNHKLVLISFALIMLLAACGGTPTAAPTASNAAASGSAPAMSMGSTMPMSGTTTAGSMGGMVMGSSAPMPTVTPGVPANVPAATPDLAAFPVTIENCGRTLTFDAPPERVVALYPMTAEVLLRLGLQDRIIGAAYTQADPVAPDLRTAFNALPVITTDAAPNRELLLSAQPDFVIGNFPGLFYVESRGLASIEQLAANGVQAYTLTARCIGNERNGTIANLYTDVENMGKIFGVPDRAAQLVEQMQARVAAVQSKIADQPKPRVLIYHSGIGPLNVFGPGAISNVMEQAGGENAFAGVDSDREFLQLSAEEIAVRDPDVFVVLQRSGGQEMSMGTTLSAEEAATFLLETFPNTTAAKNNRVVVVPYEQLYIGLQNVDGVETLARGFFPEAFE